MLQGQPLLFAQHTRGLQATPPHTPLKAFAFARRPHSHTQPHTATHTHTHTHTGGSDLALKAREVQLPGFHGTRVFRIREWAFG
jgi:hypothetical protein